MCNYMILLCCRDPDLELLSKLSKKELKFKKLDMTPLHLAMHDRLADRKKDTTLKPDAIVDIYWHLHSQHRSAWT